LAEAEEEAGSKCRSLLLNKLKTSQIQTLEQNNHHSVTMRTYKDWTKHRSA